MKKKISAYNTVEKNIAGLWNHEPYIKKYKDAKYNSRNPELDHMLNRLKTVNKLLKKNLKKKFKYSRAWIWCRSISKFIFEGRL